jgi:hypothetical protein
MLSTEPHRLFYWNEPVNLKQAADPFDKFAALSDSIIGNAAG